MICTIGMGVAGTIGTLQILTIALIWWPVRVARLPDPGRAGIDGRGAVVVSGF